MDKVNEKNVDIVGSIPIIIPTRFSWVALNGMCRSPTVNEQR